MRRGEEGKVEDGERRRGVKMREDTGSGKGKTRGEEGEDNRC